MFNCNNDKGGNTIIEIAAGTDSEKTPPAVFEKLLGTWQSEDGKSFERWKKNDDGTYRSDVYNLKGSDTSWNEQARIYPEKNQWVFENTVKGQNDGKSVKFTSTIITDNRVQFSNPAHDFPTDVNYTLLDMNTLNAFIIGPNSNGGKDTILFNSKRFR
jgi:hypothetical protein